MSAPDPESPILADLARIGELADAMRREGDACQAAADEFFAACARRVAAQPKHEESNP